MKRSRSRMLVFCLLFLIPFPVYGKSGVPFNPITDINWGEIEFTIEGVCFCPRIWGIEVGLIISYWEPFLLLDTSSVAFYSATLGTSVGGSSLDELGGKNNSSDAINLVNESTFAQSHAFLLPLMPWICNRSDYGTWWSEYDAMWQNDELAALLSPEASLYANKEMVMGCMADAIAANGGWPLDAMPWCVGSGGSAYPMTGHVDNDNIVQANATAAYRMLYKLNRIGMICDPFPLCGCMYTPVWIKSHYKMNVVRPGIRDVHPIGRATALYDSGLNTPYMGTLGSNDEFLWVVYRPATVLHMLRVSRGILAAVPVIIFLQVGSISGAGELKNDREPVEKVLEQAGILSETMTVPENSHAQEGLDAARQAAEQFHAPAFQEQLRCQMERIRGSESKQEQARASQKKGALTDQESVYLFLSSSMPEVMVNRYLIDIVRTGEQRIVPVLFGLPPGKEGKHLDADYFIRVLQIDPGCRDTPETPCQRLEVPFRINPVLFSRYSITEVPALVYENDQDAWSIHGEAELAYLLEKIGKAANSPALTGISNRLRGGQ